MIKNAIDYVKQDESMRINSRIEELEKQKNNEESKSIVIEQNQIITENNEEQQSTLLKKLTKLIPRDSIHIENCKYIIEKELTVSDVKKLGLSDEDLEEIVFKHVTLKYSDVNRNIYYYEVPKYVTHIGGCAFHYNKSLKTIKFPTTLTHIAEYAFMGCENLTLAELPENLKSIGYQAFYGCKKLEITKLPENILKIDWTAFAYCNNVYVHNLKKQYNELIKKRKSQSYSLQK
jgi:hypothetical protein